MIRRLVKIVAAIVAIIAVIAGAVGILVATQPGRDLVARVVEGAASGPGMAVEVGTIRGNLLSQFAIDSIAVADAQGTWLEIEGASIDWHPRALVNGRLAISLVDVRRVSVLRRPVAEDDAQEADAGGGGLPVEVVLDEARIHEIDLAAPLLGTPARLDLTASATLARPEEGLSGTLEVNRLDGAGGQLSGRFAYRPEGETLTVKLDAREPQGGLIARALGIEGLPEMRATVDGEGPLDDWQATLAAEAGETSLAEGTARIARAEGGRRLTARLDARLAMLVPETAAPLLGGVSVIEADALIGDDDTVTITDTSFTGETVAGLFSGVATLSGDIREANINLFLVGRNGEPVEIPVPGGDPIRAGAGQITAMIGRNGAPESVDYRVTLSDVTSAQGMLERLEVQATGERALDGDFPRQLASDVAVNAVVEGLALADPALRQAVGGRVAVSGRVRPDADGVALEDAVIDAGTATLGFTGTVGGDGVDGSFNLDSGDIGAFAALAGQPLEGSLTASGTVQAALDGSSFALDVDGSGENLAIGVDAVDRLLAGTVTLNGGIAHSGETDIRFDDFDLEAQTVTARVNGSIDGEQADLTATGTLRDLSVINRDLAGAVDLETAITGTSEDASLTLTVTGERVVINGEPLEEPAIRFSGEGSLEAMEGPLSISGRYADEAVEGEGHVRLATDGAVAVRDLDLSYGGARTTGALARSSVGEMTGDVALAVPDLSTFEAIAGLPLAGAIDLDLTLDKADDGTGRLVASGTARSLKADTVTVGEATIDATVTDLFSTPVAEGRVHARSVDAGGLAVPEVTATATADGDATRATVEATVAEARVSAGGRVGVAQSVVTVDLDEARASARGVTATLAEPARIVVEDGTARIDRMVVAAGEGRIEVAGSAGATLDLSARLDGLPMALAGAFVEGLGPQGRLSGTASARGDAASPQISYSLDWAGASIAALRDAGLPAVSISANGETRDNRVTVDGRVTGAGLNLAVSGTAPLGAGALDLAVRGTVPLALADRMLAARGATLSGPLTVNLTVKGPPGAPDVSGTLSASGGRFRDPETGIALTELTLDARLADGALRINRLTGATGDAGRLEASGRIGLMETGMPADLSITGRGVRLNANRMIDGRFDADLTLKGPLLSRPVIEGRVRLGRTVITIPEGLPASLSQLNVEHRNAPAAVRQQGEALEPKEDGGGEPMEVILDLTVEAGNQIFIRGRGLDVVMGGQMTLRGSAADPVVDGGFQMRNGTLALLGRRLTFTRGRIDFIGTLDPILDFVAETSTATARITVHVTGRAQDPQFRFESSPSLPQDEVMARLLFDRPLDQLSPFQIAQLAAEAARLGGVGGGGPGVLGQLRKDLGVDVLDVTSTEEGGAAVTAGRYIDDDLYLGFQQGTTAGSSRAVIDFSITDNIKARGEAGADGSSKIGIGVEWDY